MISPLRDNLGLRALSYLVSAEVAGHGYRGPVTGFPKPGDEGEPEVAGHGGHPSRPISVD